MFENLTCPPGPHDKTKTYAEDAPELYENVEIPVSTSHEDPYGGDNCKCECHNLDDHNLKSRSEHCVSCGTRVCRILKFYPSLLIMALIFNP